MTHWSSNPGVTSWKGYAFTCTVRFWHVDWMYPDMGNDKRVLWIVLPTQGISCIGCFSDGHFGCLPPTRVGRPNGAFATHRECEWKTDCCVLRETHLCSETCTFGFRALLVSCYPTNIGSGAGKPFRPTSPMTSPETSTTTSHTTDITKDNFIPLFNNRIADYREWRLRIGLYHRKMVLQNKKKEATINLLTSLSGLAWRQVEHAADKLADEDEGFEKVLRMLDACFKYNEKVEMPRAFEKFFFSLQRRPDQTLLSYTTEHREHLREIEKYGEWRFQQQWQDGFFYDVLA